MMAGLIVAGVIGAALDILLHILQMFHIPWATRRTASIITLVSCLGIAASLFAQFNLAAALIQLFVAGLAILALVTGKEFEH